MKLPTPFTIDEIQKYPKAVVIALLIGMLIWQIIRNEGIQNKCETEKKQLYDVIIDGQNERIALYESMIFYKRQTEYLQQQDSIVRQRTEPIVRQLLQNER